MDNRGLITIGLLGVGLWFATRRGFLSVSLGEAGDELPALPAPEPQIQNRRFLARKFYGTFVLAQQSADSMARAQAKMPAGSLRSEAEGVQATMKDTARKSLARARELDPDFIRKLCNRPNAPKCV